MSLRTRILCILFGVLVAFFSVDGIARHVMVIRTFEQLERDLATAWYAGVRDRLNQEERALDAAAASMASSLTGLDAADTSPELKAPNAGGIDLLLLCEREGKVVSHKLDDPTTGEAIRLRDFPSSALSPDNPFLHPEQGVSGLIMTERGPLIVASHVTRQGDHVVILGRFLDEHVIANLTHGAGEAVELWPIDAPPSDGFAAGVLDSIALSAEPIWNDGGGDELFVYDTLDDHRGIPILLLRAKSPRKVAQAGQESARDALISAGAIAVLTLLCLTNILQRAVIDPISRLTAHAKEIGSSDDTSRRLALDRTDEIGVLAREFDRMVDELERSRAHMVDMARAAGVSEVATGVLHNVGNYLNSVNVSARMIDRRLNGFPIAELEAVVREIQLHRDALDDYVRNDERGVHLLPFLDELQRTIVERWSSVLDETRSLMGGLSHIEQLVVMQQSHATRGLAEEWVSLDEQLDRAVEMSNKVVGEDADLEVVRRYDNVSRRQLDRFRLSQILVNLILNAREAMSRAGSSPKRLALYIAALEDGGVSIEIEDNGAGIEAEYLDRIFHHGFTTSENGHGFGLHASAIAASELKGELTAHSDGPGRGARFALRLPPPQPSAAAA